MKATQFLHRIARVIVKVNGWRKERISQNDFLIIAAAIVGAFGGFAAAILKSLAHVVAHFLKDEFHWEYKYYLYFLFPLIGLVLTFLYIKIFIRKKPFYAGIPPLIRSITHERSRIDFHNIYSQIITSALTVGMGGSAGLEAPSVYSGSAIGSNLARLFGLSYREVTLLLACGGAAGISGAFNSPIAGMIFAMEVLLPSIAIPTIIPLLISAAVASVVSSFIHAEPLFVLLPKEWDVSAFWIYIVFGIVAGFYVVGYSWLNEHTHHSFSKLKNRFVRILIGGLGLGALVALFPATYGEGYLSIQELLNKNYPSLLNDSLFSSYSNSGWFLTGFAFLTLLAKTWGSTITMGCGGNGGMFGPSVCVGGLLGFVFAFSVNQLNIAELNVTNFMIAGMAACVSGMMHAPLTGVFLAAEITGGYSLFVPLMIVSAISYFLNKRARKYSIYTRPLAQQGLLVQGKTKDETVLSAIQINELLETDFVVLKMKDQLSDRQKDIIQSERQIFGVVNETGVFVGTLTIDQLIRKMADEENLPKGLSIGEMVQPDENFAYIHSSLKAAIDAMDKQDTRYLPVVDAEKKYLGYVTKNRIFRKYREHLKKQDKFQ